MNTINPAEKFTVYQDLLHNSENAINKFLNKIPNNLDDLRVIEKAEQVADTYSLPDANFYSYARQFIQLPDLDDITLSPITTFHVQQEWEGYVQEVNDQDSTFTALLLDITANHKYPSEEADFRQSNVDKFDQHFLCPGAVFRWIIGYERSISGTIKSVSKLTFRRLPKWNKETIKRADKKAKQFKEGIIWE